MKIKNLIVFVASGLGLAATMSAATAEKRPNILVILADDLGYSDVGFNGGKDVRTPALDQLARGGTIFTSAYVAHPFCGPSRTALMTGRYPHPLGAPFNLPNSGDGIERYNQLGVPATEPFISALLHQTGYYTGAIGKWHLGITAPYHPNARGFDDFYGFLGGGHDYFPAVYGPKYDRQVKAGTKSIYEYILPLEHNGKEVTETEYLTDGLSREAVRFVREAAGKNAPFFLYLAYNAPHTPLEAKPEDLDKFAAIKDPKRRTYAAMVYAVDRGVGAIVAALKDTGAFDNTLIVFLSDNGGRSDQGASNLPLKGVKGDTFEGGYRVPMFFHWPKQVPAGKSYGHSVTALDFYPTLTHLAGATIPAGKKLDGLDIWDAFQAGRNPRLDGMIFALRYRGAYSDVGARRGQWKITRMRNASWKLFNLDEDIGETIDLSAKYPQLLRDMVAETEKWSRSHVRPLWFDSEEAEQAWDRNGMPNYHATFEVK